jgi:UDP-glucuronate 4-epimerase
VALLERGHDVAVLDALTSAPTPAAWKRNNLELLQRCAAKERRALLFFSGNCSSVSDVERVFTASSAKHVLHLAGHSGLSPGMAASEVFNANVVGTVVLLEAAARAGARSLVLASTGAVYGDDGRSGPRLCDESDAAAEQQSAYGASKRSAEMAVVALAKQHAHLQCRILRLFTVYGPRGRPDMAPWRFIRAITAGQAITVFGGGDAWRDYVYVDDVVDALLSALFLDTVGGEPGKADIFNVASGQAVTLSQFITAVEAATGVRAQRLQQPARSGDVGGTLGNPRKAAQLLGWRCTVGLDEGLRRTVAWWSTPDADAYRVEF